MRRRAILLPLAIAACAAAPERPDLTPISQGTGFITDDCIPTGRPPEPAARAAYLDAAFAWLSEPDVRQGRIRPDQFDTLAAADCGPAWLVWNTNPDGTEHFRGSLFMLISKGRNEFLKLQTR